MNDNQRMEVRAIGQEVLGLIYEWVSEEVDEEDNDVEEIATSTLNCNINTDLNNKFPHFTCISPFSFRAASARWVTVGCAFVESCPLKSMFSFL